MFNSSITPGAPCFLMTLTSHTMFSVKLEMKVALAGLSPLYPFPSVPIHWSWTSRICITWNLIKMQDSTYSETGVHPGSLAPLVLMHTVWEPLALCLPVRSHSCAPQFPPHGAPGLLLPACLALLDRMQNHELLPGPPRTGGSESTCVESMLSSTSLKNRKPVINHLLSRSLMEK